VSPKFRNESKKRSYRLLATRASQSLPGSRVDECKRPVPLLVRHMPSVPKALDPGLHDDENGLKDGIS
jgi:hypothetical protein